MKLKSFLFGYKLFIMKVVIIMLLIALGIIGGLKFFESCNYQSPKKLEIKPKIEFVMDHNKVKKVVLKNGLTVLVFKNTSTPKVLMQIAYDIGSNVEKDGERGLAHLIEHMIFKGTKNLSETDIDSIARKYGADFNAFTGKDMTSYYFEVNKNNWKPFLGILADCMQNARFEQEHLASEFKAVIQELKMYKDRYWSCMLEKASSLIYPANHPYHYPIIGYKQDLVNLSAQNLKKFYKKYYKPEHATLFIVGDVDIDQVVEQAKKDFENIKIDNNTEKSVEQEAFFPQLSYDLIEHKTTMFEDVKKEQVGLYWLIPGLKYVDDTLVSVIEFILGQGEGSRLYRRLVDEEKVAVDLAVFADHLKEAGIFLILLEPIDGKIEECKKFISEEIYNLINNGVTKEELNKVICTKSREFFQSMQNLEGFTGEWIKSYLITKDEFDVFNKNKKFIGITSESIVDFTKNYLDPFFMNQIQLLPLPEDKRNFWQKNKEESEKLDKEILGKHVRTTPVEEPKAIKNYADPENLSFAFPKPDLEFNLSNGLEVLLLKNDQWPLVSLNFRIKDSDYWSQTKDGILFNLLMSLLIEGSVSSSKEENVNFFEDLGVAYNFDVSGASFTLLSDVYKPVFVKILEIFTKPTFPKDALEKIKEIDIDLYQRGKDSPNEMAVRLLKNLVYKNHPYEWTFDQAIEIIKNAKISQLKDLYKKYLNPENMILTVVGNFDADELKNNLENIFGAWQNSGQKLVKQKTERDFKVGQNIDHFMLRDQVFLILGQTSNLDIYNPDLIPVKMLNLITFDSLGSRLYKVREQTGLFYTAFGSFGAAATKEQGFDYVGSILSLDKLDLAQKAILGVINELGLNGVTDQEIDVAKQLYLKGLIDVAASNEAVAAVLGRIEDYKLGFDYYDKVLKRVQNMSKTELNEICKKYFTTDRLSRVRVGRVGEKS